MMTYPKLLATSVIRGSMQGDSHGGIYLIDFNSGTVEQKLDWNNCEIDFTGRGADRGLRGIAFHDNNVFIAASNEIFIFDQSFKKLYSITSPYLKHCHEIYIYDGKLYITSTGFDSLLVYNLSQQKFDTAYYIESQNNSFKPLQFDPEKHQGPALSNRLHINNIFCRKDGLYFSGRKTTFIFRLHNTQLSGFAKIPLGTHNAQPHNDGIIYNDTASDQVCFLQNEKQLTFPVPDYNSTDVINFHSCHSDIARIGFGRGLCRISNHIVATGSSPSTIAIHSLQSNKTLKKINISMDIRNAIHGLEIWPYS